MADFSNAMIAHILEQAQQDPNSPLAQSLQRSPVSPSLAGTTSPAGPMLAAGAGDLTDLLTTYRNMSNGAGDLNPTLRTGHPVASAAILAGEDLAMQYLIHKLSANHSTLAKLVGYGEGGLGLFNTIRNAKVGGRFEPIGTPANGTPLRVPLAPSTAAK